MTSVEECLSDRKWYVFILTSIITFLGGLLIILFARLIVKITRRQRHAKSADKQSDLSKPSTSSIVLWYSKAQWWAEQCVSGEKLAGRITISTAFVVSIGSLVVYFIDAKNVSDSYGNTIETCDSWDTTTMQKLDYAFNMFFLIYFILRFIAANDKLLFWLALNSLVDYFTIPPEFVSIIIKRDWLGLRFLRAIRLMSLPDILQYLNVLRNTAAIRLAELICASISLWIAASGFIFLLEISGDPFQDFQNRQNITVGDTLYFITVTLTTVGYGDITMKTVLGRGFNIIVLICGIALFAKYIPELAGLLEGKQGSRTNFKSKRGFSHVVVCGFIDFKTVRGFLGDFLHEDRETKHIKCIFLDTQKPDMNLAALLKRHTTRTTFMHGTAMSPEDLNMVGLHEAQACIVLADINSSDPENEDAMNTMRVISLKTFNPQLRVIVQIISYHNKVFLESLPYWRQTDQVICLPELKQGFFSSSSLAPGISTLFGNLLVMRSYKPTSETPTWQRMYMTGANNELYTVPFSPAFYGLTFQQAARICYTKLHLLLLATKEMSSNHSRAHICLNPGDKITIDSSHSAIIICQAENEALRVQLFCPTCHESEEKIMRLKKCRCFNQSLERSLMPSNVGNASENNNQRLRDDSRNNRRTDSVSLQLSNLISYTKYPNNQHQLFIMRHETQKQPWAQLCNSTVHKFEDCLLKNSSNLKNHVILCVFCDSTSSAMSLRNFIVPLRSNNLLPGQLQPIVIVVDDESFIRKEWDLLNTFSDLYVILKSPLNTSVLRSVRVDTCSACVICSLYEHTSFTDPYLVDKDAILCSLSVKSILSELAAEQQGFNEKEFNLLVELRRQENIRFLVDDVNQKYDDDPFVSLPFASGQAFAVSLLDTLTSTVFFNSDILHFIRLPYTGINSESTSTSSGSSSKKTESHDNSAIFTRANQMVLFDLHPDFFNFSQEHTYGELFVNALDRYNALCLGIYRKRPKDPMSSAATSSRVVITNPPSNLPLEQNDKVYAFCPDNAALSQYYSHSDPQQMTSHRNGTVNNQDKNVAEITPTASYL